MRETKSECNGCGAIHISFDYKVLVSSMGPLAGNAGLFTTLEQTQMSMSINSLIIIFEWIFTALPICLSPRSFEWVLSGILESQRKPHNWIAFVEDILRGKSFRPWWSHLENLELAMRRASVSKIGFRNHDSETLTWLFIVGKIISADLHTISLIKNEN